MLSMFKIHQGMVGMASARSLSSSSAITPSATAVWAQEALHAFDVVVAQHSRFRPRLGQRQMAQAVADVFSEAKLGELPEKDRPPADTIATPQHRVAVIQAGTGVGKSLAYCAPALALAQARQTRLLIATATVALQEQLVHQDLPTLAANWPEPFRFALAKGRGRYVCRLKLERLVGSDGGGDLGDLFLDDLMAFAEDGPQGLSAQLTYWGHLSQALHTGTWDGDRDSLPSTPDARQWQPIAAEASSCTAKHCPLFESCAYFEQRKQLVGAQVIVVNHDLLLSSLGKRSLPELDECLLVIDEAHHLPRVAVEQFTASTDLTRLNWIDPLAQRAVQVGDALLKPHAKQALQHAATLRLALQALAKGVVSDIWQGGQTPLDVARIRLPKGSVSEGLAALLMVVRDAANAWLSQLSTLAKDLKTEMKERPEDARRLSGLYAQMGSLAPRLEAVADTSMWLLSGTGETHSPVAKWFTRQPAPDGSVQLRVHACPILPAEVLREHLWPKARAVVLTSATLTSCGRFDFFLSETGLNELPTHEVHTLEVPSPFNYPTQGRFEIVTTQTDPREASAFTAEMVALLVADLQQVQQGALVLCTSREQLRQLVLALPANLRDRALVQGEWPRTTLLQRHRERVGLGQVSIVIGLQSFGEGLDLPGALCATLFITKLPFASPDDPVSEARAEWLMQQGDNPFMALTVPATSVRLAQWAGRAIRTETDTARIVCYDRRLIRTHYGKHLLQGLPPFSLEVR